MGEIELVFHEIDDTVVEVPFDLQSGTILIHVSEVGDNVRFDVTSAENYENVRAILELVVGWLPTDE